MKKWLSALLCIALCFGLVLPAMATNTQGITFTAALDKETLNVSNRAQTVKLKIYGTPAFDADAFEYEVDYPEGWTIENIASSDVSITAGDYNKAYGEHTLKLFWNSPDAENVTGISDLGTVIFTVPANTAAGDYDFTVKEFTITKDYGTKWEQGSTMTATLTIKGEEAETSCIVRFNANGGSGTMKNVSVEAGSDYTLPKCRFSAPSGQQFRAWGLGSEEYLSGDVYRIDADVTFLALWEQIPELATVRFHLCGGKADEITDGKRVTYYADDEGFALPEAYRSGYNFEGWFDEPTGGWEYTVVSSYLPDDLYAQWSEIKSPEPDTINVTFRLIGAELATQDVDLGAKEYMPDYVTWVPTTRYELEEGATVYDLWVKATTEAGITSVGASKNYVEKVYAPDSLGGYALSEFSNGFRSGWMYTINGIHPGYGLKEWDLYDGDQVIWHFVNDYSYEVDDWAGDSKYPTLGDGSYWNRWLMAPDRYGGKGGSLGENSTVYENEVSPTTHGTVMIDPVKAKKGDTVTITVKPDEGYEAASVVVMDSKDNTIATRKNAEGIYIFTQPASAVTVTVPFREKTGNAEISKALITVKPEVIDGGASAEITAENVTEALRQAGSIRTLAVRVDTEKADSVAVSLPADAVKVVSDAGIGLNVETENGTAKLDVDTVGNLAVTGKAVTVNVKKNADGTTTFDVTAGGRSVNEEIKIEMPATGNGQVLVIVKPDGTQEIVKKSVVENGKVYAEIPAGAKVKTIHNEKSFPDVANNAWHKSAVDFASSHELFQGTDKGFEPNSPMTRAMLATVLYRLEGAIATGGNSFADVPSGMWYTDAVTWASANGIVTGTDKGFEPNVNITREQIATMLYCYAKLLGLDTSGRSGLNGFSDGSKTSSWANEAMQWAVSVGLFKGDDNGALNPQGDATRAEVATLMQRLVRLLVKES